MEARFCSFRWKKIFYIDAESSYGLDMSQSLAYADTHFEAIVNSVGIQKTITQRDLL